jgi:Zn-dependent M28 family amino/carboxypeptidase
MPRVACLLAAALTLGAARPTTEDPLLAEALSRVSGRAVRAHVEFLADDLLEGRATGTRGYDIAARYVVAELAGLGLAPAGENGGYLQQVPLLQSRLVEGTLSLTGVSGKTVLTPREEFLMAADTSRTESRVEAPVVFAGYGVRAPRQGQDDYAGLEVKGKIVAVLSGAPARFPSEERAYHASRSRKAELAAERGAVGVLALRPPAEEARTPWPRLVDTASAPQARWIRPDGTPEGALPGLRGSALLSAAAARQLFAASPLPLDEAFAAAGQPSFRGFPLGASATLTARSEHSRITSPNVIGLLEGSDPALRSSYVVYSAHLDHVGPSAEGAGDRIHNGAYDNALGVGVVLEVARVLAGLEPRPRRSLLFLFVTAEEQGLLGSDYFAANPTVPKAGIAANVNVDMPLLLFPPAEVVAFGAENSTLEGAARAAAGAAGLALAPDPMPEETIFVRSDQYSFVRRGVPAVYFSPGMRSADAAQDGPRLFREFLGRHYHRPSDDLSLPMDLGAIALYTRANVALGFEIAQDPRAPSWKPGNFFAETFGGGGSGAAPRGARPIAP